MPEMPHIALQPTPLGEKSLGLVPERAIFAAPTLKLSREPADSLEALTRDG